MENYESKLWEQEQYKEGVAVEKYESLFWAQEEGAEEYLTLIEEKGEEEGLKYILRNCVYDEPGDIYNDRCWGSRDTVYRQGEYLLTYYRGLGYVGVYRKVS